MALRSDDPTPGEAEYTAADASNVAEGNEGRLARLGATTHLTLPPAPTGAELAEAAAAAATVAAAPGTEAPASPAPQTETPAPKPAAMKQDDAAHVHGYDLHNYMDHVVSSLGAQMLAPGQAAYGGYQWVGPKQIQAEAPISGLRPVIEQAISDVKERNGNQTGEEMEARVAKRLTELNDWDNLNRGTRAKMLILSGLDIESMSDNEREDRINHVLHSPIPFGDIPEVLTPDVTIDLGYTHTLDKEWTKAVDLGNGVYQIWMVSNNDNGAHTGHSLGSFKVQLAPGTSIQQARAVGNEMVRNKNDNDRLHLDAAAKNVLYGLTPLLDFSQKQPEPTTTTTAVPETTASTTADTSTTVTTPEGSTTAPDPTSTSVPETTVAESTTTTTTPTA